MQQTSKIITYVLLAISILYAGACSRHSGKIMKTQYCLTRDVTISAPGSDSSGKVEIYYTGCGGYIIKYRDEILLTDPFYSYASTWNTLTRDLRSDTALISDLLLKATGSPRDAGGKISTILVSHAHHDHIGDLPTLLRHYLNDSKVAVYGSNTLVNTLLSFPDIATNNLLKINDLEAKFTYISQAPGVKCRPAMTTWFYTAGQHIRFSAIPSEHAPHYKLIVPMHMPGSGGSIKKPREKPPKRALQYKEGINFNYLIELLDDNGKPQFRIFYNAGSGCTGGVGLPPSQMLEDIDLLMICGASFKYVDNYPDYLLDKLRPKTVFVGHWESFFEPISKLHDHPKTAPLNNIPQLMDQIYQYRASKGYPANIFSALPMSYSMTFKF